MKVSNTLNYVLWFFFFFFFQQTAENLASAGAFSLLSLLFVGGHIAFLFLLACTNYATQ